MAAYTVEPESLTAAAGVVKSIGDNAAITSRAECADAGHAGLAEAIAGFNVGVAASWQRRLDATGSVAEGLRRTAAIFLAADDEGAADGRALGAGAF